MQALGKLKAACSDKGVDDRGLVGLMQEYRSNAQLLNCYTGLILPAVNPATGRIHTTFNQTGAVRRALPACLAARVDNKLQGLFSMYCIGTSCTCKVVSPPQTSIRHTSKMYLPVSQGPKHPSRLPTPS